MYFMTENKTLKVLTNSVKLGDLDELYATQGLPLKAAKCNEILII